MKNTDFPFKAWITQPAGKAVEHTIEGPPKWASIDYFFVVSATGKMIPRSDLFESKRQALEARLAQLKKQAARLKKQQTTLLNRTKLINKQLGELEE